MSVLLTYLLLHVISFSLQLWWLLTDGTKSIDCEFEEHGALPACGYETAPHSKLNWTLRSQGNLNNVVHTPTSQLVRQILLFIEVELV